MAELTGLERLLEKREIQFAGKLSFLIGLVGGALNIIVRMTILHEAIVICSGVLGLIFMFYKLHKVRMDIIEQNEKRVAAGKKPITVGYRVKKLFSRKSKKQDD